MGLLQHVGLDKADGLRQGHTAARWGLEAGGWAQRRAVPFGFTYPAVGLACAWEGRLPLALKVSQLR